MPQGFKKWMAEAWPGYLIVGMLTMMGSAAWFRPPTVIVFGVLGSVLGIVVRAVQYIGYDFSAPDNN